MVFYAKSEAPIELVAKPDAPPTPPLVIWGPGDPRPTVPIAGWDPGTGNWPETEPLPPQIWGPNDPRPTVPIAEPPWGWGGTPPEVPTPPNFPFEPVAAWTPDTGWVTILVPTGPVPTPSKRR